MGRGRGSTMQGRGWSRGRAGAGWAGSGLRAGAASVPYGQRAALSWLWLWLSEATLTFRFLTRRAQGISAGWACPLCSRCRTSLQAREWHPACPTCSQGGHGWPRESLSCAECDQDRKERPSPGRAPYLKEGREQCGQCGRDPADHRCRPTSRERVGWCVTLRVCPSVSTPQCDGPSTCPLCPTGLLNVLPSQCPSGTKWPAAAQPTAGPGLWPWLRKTTVP